MDISNQLHFLGKQSEKRFGAFIKHPERFDNVVFGVSAQEARCMDPQQRHLLETSYEAHAALSETGRIETSHSATSVTVGVSYNEYFHNISYIEGINAFSATSGTLSVICGRLSFCFGLKGPSISIDTACSSSLVGVHLSITSFIPQGCHHSISCGVNLILQPYTTTVLAGAGMLCDDGRCKTFDSRADGYGRGETAIVLLLSVLHGDIMTSQPYIVLQSTAVGQDGKSSSLTAPNGPAQQAVVSACLQIGRMKPCDVSFVEMHGTGTGLGDPIEVGAATAVLGQARTEPLVLQSSKSQLLHTEPAAGAVGLACAAFRSIGTSLRFVPTLNNFNVHISRLTKIHDSSEQQFAGWCIARQPQSQPLR